MTVIFCITAVLDTEAKLVNVEDRHAKLTVFLRDAPHLLKMRVRVAQERRGFRNGVKWMALNATPRSSECRVWGWTR